jgi:tight adherence protein C
MYLLLADLSTFDVFLASLPALACIFVGLALLVVGFFRPKPDTDFDAAFRVNVDNLNRRTIFDIRELRPVLWPFHEIAQRVAIDSFRRRILQNLRSSGNPNGYSPDEYITLCLLTGLAFLAALLIFFLVFVGSWPIWFFYLLAFVTGFWFCDSLLASKAHRRLREIAVQLPYALDLLAMTMQAGATFYEAAKTVSDEDQTEALNQELGIVVREIEFGRSRHEALVHFSERIPVRSLNSIIAAVLQAEQLGTPLAEVLLLQANLLRMYRSTRAEKKLGEATVKLLIPSTLIFVSVVFIIFGPVLVRYFKGEIM